MRSLLLLALASAPAFAQSNSDTAAARLLWESNRGFISASATDMPENLYAYRPTPEVRTFGELIGHVAGSQNMFCAMVLGDKQPAEDAIEKTAKTKAALVDALKKPRLLSHRRRAAAVAEFDCAKAGADARARRRSERIEKSS